MPEEVAMTEIRTCKFCGLECIASDRGRADCYICRQAHERLRQFDRLTRENMLLTARVRELEKRLAAINEEALG
jgi:biotin carboxylase